MPVQSINMESDNIKLIRQRLREAQPGRRKSNSVASLVEVLRDDIAAHRERGLTWEAIAEAILEDETKQAAIRSAFQRLPTRAPDQTAQTASRKTRTKSDRLLSHQEARGHQHAGRATRFDTTSMIDSYGSGDNN